MNARSVSVPSEMPRLVARLQPVIDRVATIPVSVHRKLQVGFLAGALLLLAMGGLSVAVLARIAERDQELSLVESRVDNLRQMQYLLTAQSHNRAMALLTHDQNNLDSLATAKAGFLAHLDSIERESSPAQRGLISRVRAASDRFGDSGDRVLQLQTQGADVQAMQLHLQEEHPISHEIEGAIAALLNDAVHQASEARSTLASDLRLLIWLVVGFSVLSLGTALLLGFTLSWSFVLPLRRIHSGLARLAAGRFDEPVEVANRDEFGELGRNLDTTRLELARLYGELEKLNAQLRGTNTELVAQLQEQVVELARSRSMITEAEERLRRDIAEVLHSRVQNRLLVVWYRLEECHNLVEADPDSAKRLLTSVREQVNEIREHDVRELSHRLHPSIIRAGLLPALESLAEEVPWPAVHLNAEPNIEALDGVADGGLPESVRLTAYRVVEEALGNVARHASASRVDVDVRADAGVLLVNVRDNGRGFEKRRLTPGLGLAAIAARIERIGGAWTIESDEGLGTCLSARLPYSVHQSQDSLDAQVAL